jgi:hypothetical protein
MTNKKIFVERGCISSHPHTGFKNSIEGIPKHLVDVPEAIWVDTEKRKEYLKTLNLPKLLKTPTETPEIPTEPLIV